VQREQVMSHSFRPATIRDMELTLLKTLQWHLACVTPFSFLQLLLPLITSCTVPATAWTWRRQPWRAWCSSTMASELCVEDPVMALGDLLRKVEVVD
jgi:hypothetical protein